MSIYRTESLSAQEWEHITGVAEGVAGEVRELIDATVRTEVDDDAIAAAREHIAAATAILRGQQMDGAFGVRFSEHGKRNWGNAVCGLRNPIAPPLRMTFDGERITGTAELGAAYEGPSGLVHGGMIAAMLDQALGSVAEMSGRPGMTGTLTIKYLRGTKLGPITVESWIDREDGVKTFAKGTVSTADGVTVEAEGVFILPKWAREAARKLREKYAVGEG